MMLSLSHPLRDKTTSRSRQTRAYAPLFTHIVGALFSPSDAEETVILSRDSVTWHAQDSHRAGSFITLHGETLGAHRHLSSGMGENLDKGVSSVLENEVFKTPFKQ